MKVTIFQDVFKKNKEHAHVIQLATALKRIKEGKSQSLIKRYGMAQRTSKRNYLSSSSQGNLKNVMMRRLRNTANSLYSTSTTLMLRHPRRFYPRILMYIAVGFLRVVTDLRRSLR